MSVSIIGRGGVGGRPVGCGDVSPLQPKHYIPIYHDLSYIGAVYGVREATRSSGDQYMVVSGSIVLGESGNCQGRQMHRIGWKGRNMETI